MRQPYFARKQSITINNLVSELNAALGASYFNVKYKSEVRGYTINPTKLCIAKNAFNFVSFEGDMPYDQIYQYLSGILIGIKIGQQNLTKI